MENADMTSSNSFADEVEVDLDVLGVLMLKGVEGHAH